MRFFFIAAGLAALSVVFAASAAEASLTSSLDISLNRNNFYGAPIPPWKKGCKPGWYYGDHPSNWPQLPWLKDSLICRILELLPFGLHCPKPPPTCSPSDGYTPTFSNMTAATQADDYMTYGLVDTIADCKAMCANESDCKFVNTYHDNNAKDGSTQLTCSLFKKCHSEKDSINAGGQTQPDGSINFITNSDGFCKN